jgi:hypothetical protein
MYLGTTSIRLRSHTIPIQLLHPIRPTELLTRGWCSLRSSSPATEPLTTVMQGNRTMSHTLTSVTKSHQDCRPALWCPLCHYGKPVWLSRYRDWLRLDGRRVGFQIPVAARFFSFPRRSDRLLGPPYPLSNWYRELFPENKEVESWNWPFTLN